LGGEGKGIKDLIIIKRSKSEEELKAISNLPMFERLRVP